MDTATRKPEFDPVAFAAARASALLAAPRAGLRHLQPCFTRTGGALGFDLAVFVALGLMAWSLLTPWGAALSEGAGWMLACLLVFTAFWCSIAAADLDRFRTLRRRFLARAALPAAPPRAAGPATPALAPLRVRSAYRPVRPARPLPSRSLWRAVSRSH